MSINKKLRSLLHPMRASWIGISDLVREWFMYRSIAVRTRLPGHTISLDVGGQSIRLACRGSLAAWVMTGKQFEPGETKCFLTLLAPKQTILDIGANVGYFSMIAAFRHPDSTVHSFEPVKSTYALLSQNIKLNHLMNIKTIPVALSDTVGNATMQINVLGREGLNTMGKPAHASSKVIGTAVVPTMPLDKYIEDVGIERVDLIKIDVEGAELLVLKGATKLLSRHDAPIIIFEVSNLYEEGFGYKFQDILDLLTGFGYKVSQVDGESGEISALNTAIGSQTTAIAVKPQETI